jgi:hypothetical protein
MQIAMTRSLHSTNAFFTQNFSPKREILNENFEKEMIFGGFQSPEVRGGVGWGINK